MRRTPPKRRLFCPLVTLVVVGCQSAVERLDESVANVLRETNRSVGEEVLPARADVYETPPPGVYDTPATVNPSASELTFVPSPARDTDVLVGRLRDYNEPGPDAIRMALPESLSYAMQRAREYRFAEEEYLLAALRLLIERHRWGPRFFNDISADVFADGDGGLYDSSLVLVNDFAVTQRLPYGGEVAARALATATHDLHQRVAGENVESAEFILDASIPLMRGAGMTAREPLIQAERDVIYAARDFARLRRSFLFDIASDYLDLIVSRKRAETAQLGVDSFRQLEIQQDALYRAGRSTPFDLAEAQNETLEAVDRVNASWETYRLATDRFKSRIGMPVEQPLVIADDWPDLPVPVTTLDTAVAAAMQYRLDLQNERDIVGDAERGVAVARNALLGDLNLRGSVTIPTDPTRSGFRFDGKDTDFAAGITYGLPLDREIERLRVRDAEVDLERAYRAYDRFRDNVAINVRAAVRGIDAAAFSLGIQEANVEIARQREASIQAEPGRADVRQKTDAINQISRARDNRDQSQRDLEVAILGYLLATGQLRVDTRGRLAPLAGMRLNAPGAADEGLGAE